MTALIDFFLTRRSVVAAGLEPPGPNDNELKQILTAASRVPDHKKLAPWRFVVFQGEARKKFGEVLAKALKQNEADVSQERLETEENRFMRAPLVIAVISSPVEKPGVPEWEQSLSAGAACMNLLNAAMALGFAGQWITEWYSYDAAVAKELGLAETEKVAGFIYLGTKTQAPSERPRPELSDVVSYWGS